MFPLIVQEKDIQQFQYLWFSAILKGFIDRTVLKLLLFSFHNAFCFNGLYEYKYIF